jgi:hypothetical protein
MMLCSFEDDRTRSTHAPLQTFSSLIEFNIRNLQLLVVLFVKKSNHTLYIYYFAGISENEQKFLPNRRSNGNTGNSK